MATSAESTKHSSGFLVAPRVPQGLAAAVEGLTREVIRHRPEDIYVFAAHHFEKLLKMREEYGTTGIPLEKDSRTLRDMGLTHLIGTGRGKVAAGVKNEDERSGWSLNQTAKVLKRHRSIIGDSEDVAEHFGHANDNQTLGSTLKMPPNMHTCTKTPRHHRKSLTKLVNESSLSNESQSGDSEACSTPKILSQMSNTGMTSKDIKYELRKNKISSRDRRAIPRCEDRKRIDRVNTTYESFECLSKSSSRKSSITMKKSENGQDSSRKLKNTPSMDKLKDYVVHKFSSTKSLEELESIHYVEKVQEIIDHTEPIIKEKVEELKKEVYKSRKKSKILVSNNNDILESKLNETQKLLERVSSTLSKSSGRSRSARGLRRIRSISMVSTEGLDDEGREEVKISELLITNGQKDGLDVRINDPTSSIDEHKRRRSLSAKANRKRMFEPENSVSDTSTLKGEALESMLNETRNILAGISSSFVMQNGFRRSRECKSGSSSSKSEESDLQNLLGTCKISLPVVQPKSAKNFNRNTQKTDTEEFVLPAISPEAPKSAKRKEDLVLPILSSPGSSSSKEPDILEVPVEEVFRDSLNVTPESLDFGPRPDSLEPEERIEDIEPPTSELRDKLLEIQNIERNIQKVFGNETIIEPEVKQHDETQYELKDKLVELMAVEKGIENVLDTTKIISQPASNSSGDGQSVKLESVMAASDTSKENATRLRDQGRDGNGENRISNNEEPEVSPHTYILTEGSPYDIPESVTTVIIPDPPKTPESQKNKLPELPGIEESDEFEKSSVRDPLDSFGEEVHSEEQNESLIDLIPSKSDQIIQKPLQCINEEEGVEEEEAMTGVSEVPSSFLDVDDDGTEFKSSAIDVSDDFTRHGAISISSTSAKETSITDGPMDTPKLPPESGEEGTSESGTVESSNEAKETTLTDGTSFSIDPTRPFVPELNLDSLQDITVSSFKITEDEYEPGETENTNSFSETLTPDDNQRIITGNGREEMNSPEAGVILENNASISASLNNIKDDEVEEPCIQEFVEVKEPICEKETVYVTEPSMTVEKTESDIMQVQEMSEESPTESDLELQEEKIDDENEEKESESDQRTENFVEEDTPLAVSRSASQCTTRRVSSGNLARLKEDIHLEEEEEEEELKSEEVKVKFSSEDRKESGIGTDVLAEEEICPVAVRENADEAPGIMENKEYHIYVPELDQSEDSSSESSFNSAATKIQAGVRGFLTRRRLQRMHHLSSTLNGVPSIQDSIVADERSLETLEVPGKLLPELEDAATTIQSNFRGYKARKRLRREDAMQRTTISMEQRPFAENGIHHTGEFHDCIPLPLFDFPHNISTRPTNELLTNEDDQAEKKPSRSRMGMIFGIPPILQFGITPKLSQLVDIMAFTKEESAVESGYLNFITSVEDAEASPVTQGFIKPPATPGSDVSIESTREFVDLSPRRGVIIEEITSLEAAKIMNEIKENENTSVASKDDAENIQDTREITEAVDEKSEALEQVQEEEESDEVHPEVDIVGVLEAPLATLGFPMKQGKLLHYGSEEFGAFHARRPILEVTLTPGDPMKSLSLSQESQLAGERIESPITMMQIAPGRGPSLLQDDSSEMIGGDERKDGESSELLENESIKKEDVEKI